MVSFNKLISRYDYHYPEEAVALKPALPRDSAKLLIYNKVKKTVFYDTFFNLAQYLPPESLLVLNDTKVLPARLIVEKPSGGKVRLLFIDLKSEPLKALADKKLDLGSMVRVDRKHCFKILNYREGEYYLQPNFPSQKLRKLLEKSGLTPLPPYLKYSPLKEGERRKFYQTVFAKNPGSVAAPTASLHFTPRLIKKLQRAGHEIVKVTLHVNLGTFAPLTEKEIVTGRLHEEEFTVSAAAYKKIQKAKKEGRAILPVGTTSLRVLETVASQKHSKLKGKTNIFIREGYKFKTATGLITNFHVPQSSLLMLVSAIIGRKKTLELYREAIDKGFKIFSFGDGMLLTK
ncbi:MAG: tRNA preQ1(34) S-adenosylmethionine ribosyltransferase-isomerase QueA [Anaplasmataceae bacterium]|nr:tRNA preQ1(34) S-adenosylmethionine ribosyltransferase-isomerase QueA [Anaplasmataceae bacterium]